MGTVREIALIQVGSKLNDYEVVARLRSGGMAALYLGRRIGIAGVSRPVAIKVIHPHLSEDKTFVTMFVDEAKLSARISHPNVVHVEELGQRGSFYYLVMEYVHGCSLSQLVRALRARGRRFTPEVAASIVIQVADGLHAAHETVGDDGASLGVVHRDVSPQNVLLSYRGHVKLIDFGVAKARGRAQHTTVASLKGKLRYMAPEQASSLPVDRRTDVYALGIVLWEILTMRTLFKAENDLKLHDLVKSPVIEPPSQHAEGVSPALDAVVMKALSPNPDDRYATTQDFRRALVQAVPESLEIDADQISDLLVAVMSETMRDQHRRLPESVSGHLRRELGAAASVIDEPGEPADPDIVNTLTTTASSLLNTDGSLIDSRGSQSQSAVHHDFGYEGAPLDDHEHGASMAPAPSWMRWVAMAAVIAMVGVLAYFIVSPKQGGGETTTETVDGDGVATGASDPAVDAPVRASNEVTNVQRPDGATTTPPVIAEATPEPEPKPEPDVAEERPKVSRPAAEAKPKRTKAEPGTIDSLIREGEPKREAPKVQGLVGPDG